MIGFVEMRLGNYFAQSRSKVIKKMSFLSFYEQNGKKVKADLKVIGKLIWAWMENLFLFHNKHNKSWKLENCLNEKSLSKCNSSKWWSEFLDSNLLSHSNVIACSGKKKIRKHQNSLSRNWKVSWEKSGRNSRHKFQCGLKHNF